MASDGILGRLSAALHEDRWVRGQCDGISLSSTASQIILEGSVRDVAAKRRAVSLAELMADGLAVVDRLRRTAAESAGDDELAQAAAKRLGEEPAFREYRLAAVKDGRLETLSDPEANPGRYQIVVSVEEAAVTLAGKVGSLSHRRLAEALIWWLDACEAVRNELAVEPDEEDNDNELNDAVRMVLDKDPLVDASQLHVGTAAGIVQLEGALINPSQRARVVQDVWLVSGVWDVDDRIQTLD